MAGRHEPPRTRLEGPLLLEPTVHGDARGFFLETFRASTLAELGVHEEWVQDNHSRSARGVLRGMHFQPGMAKLVRCARGSILDVCGHPAGLGVVRRAGRATSWTTSATISSTSRTASRTASASSRRPRT